MKSYHHGQESGEKDSKLILVHVQFVVIVVQSPSRVRLFVTPGTSAHQAFQSFTISQNSLKLMSIESVMPSNHLILCYPLLLLPSIFPSIRVFSSESALCIRWPKYWSFSFNPSNEHWIFMKLNEYWIFMKLNGCCIFMNIENSFNSKGRFPLGLTGLISLLSRGLSIVFSSTTVQKHQFSVFSLLYDPSQIHTSLLEKP